MSTVMPGEAVASESSPPFKEAEAPFDSTAESHNSGFNLRILSSDNVQFYVNSFTLTFESPQSMFSHMISDAQRNPGEFFRLDEPASVLLPLFRVCSPGGSSRFSSIETLDAVATVAKKYVLDAAMVRLSEMLLDSEMIINSPLAAYCLGCHYRWPSVCLKAARMCFQVYATTIKLLRSSCPQLEKISGKEFQSLLLFHELLDIRKNSGHHQSTIKDWELDLWFNVQRRREEESRARIRNYA